ncbi:MAG: hypothetical protein JWN38_1233 [Candidatus Saccharibacteria bacterium]|nr:hypothetical protein [Candidatus Saccharibacteria bacterium]
MKATWNGQVLAEADKDDLIYIEGNWYFPPSALKHELIAPSNTHTICPWKGEASYYDAVVDGQTNKDAIWYYPEPKAGSVERVKKDFKDFVAFWHGVEVTE